MDQEVEAGQTRATFQSLILLLMTIPGIDVLSARIILSEIGRDMSRFPTAAHLLSWAGSCPRNDESAGKRRSTRLRKGAPWLKILLVQCAQAAARKKGSYFNAHSSAFAGAEVRRKRPVRLRLHFSRPSTTCSKTARNSRISVPTILIAARKT